MMMSEIFEKDLEQTFNETKLKNFKRCLIAQEENIKDSCFPKTLQSEFDWDVFFDFIINSEDKLIRKVLAETDKNMFSTGINDCDMLLLKIIVLEKRIDKIIEKIKNKGS